MFKTLNNRYQRELNCLKCVPILMDIAKKNKSTTLMFSYVLPWHSSHLLSTSSQSSVDERHIDVDVSLSQGHHLPHLQGQHETLVYGQGVGPSQTSQTSCLKTVITVTWCTGAHYQKDQWIPLYVLANSTRVHCTYSIAVCNTVVIVILTYMDSTLGNVYSIM